MNIDPDQRYEKLLGGGITHGSLVGVTCDYMPVIEPQGMSFIGPARAEGTIARASGIDIVITSDRSKWTRCAVVELCPYQDLAIGNAKPGTLRRSLSVNQDGNPDGSGTMGMGWFPGYAIDVESGHRLHMAFGENSYMTSGNGGDMIWNPTSEIFSETGVPVMGGLHAVYVFGVGIDGTPCPYYDGLNTWVYDRYLEETNLSYRQLYTNLMWVMYPLLKESQTLLSSDVRLKVRLNTEYQVYNATNSNGGYPHYGWSMDPYRTDRENQDAAVSVLDLINIVPNPYYAYSEYERNKVDTRIKITNLPEKCTVSIYNVSGKLINQFKKDSPQTYLDWNLTNRAGIPVASGVYLVHVDIPGVGEVVRKAFLSMRVPDLEGF